MPRSEATFAGSRRFHHRFFDNDRFRRRFFFNRNGFGFNGVCGGFAFPHRRFFGGDFDCFGGGFFFDPFFLDSFDNSFVDTSPDSGTPAADSLNAMEAEEDADAQAQSTSSYVGEGDSAAPTDSNGSEFPASEKSDEPVALLQLRDGSMYGLTDYWVQNGMLHYRTTYGGENSIALDRIDIPKTQQLNAQRGFVLDLEARKH